MIINDIKCKELDQILLELYEGNKRDMDKMLVQLNKSRRRVQRKSKIKNILTYIK